MKRQIKVICSLAVAICMSAVGVVSARADSLDLTKNTLSLKVSIPSTMSTADQLAEDESASGNTLVYDLYQIATVTDEGGFSYEVLSDYDQYKADIDEAAKIIKETTDGEAAGDTKSWEDVAQELAAEILGAEEGNTVSALDPTTTEGYAGLALNTENEITEAGFYLLVARSSQVGATVVKSVTQDDSTDSILTTYTLIGSHTYTFKPQLISIPNTETKNSTTGDWDYNIEIELKPETTPATGSIEIDKTLTGYTEGTQNATFVFRVDAYDPDDNSLISSEVYAMTFTEAGNQSITVDGLPVGATVEVSEIYSGVNYKCTVDSPITLTVGEDNENPAAASFTNEPTGSRAGGGGVTNYFVYEKQEDGTFNWSWEEHWDGNITTSNGLSDKLLQQIMNNLSAQTAGSVE